MGMMSDWTPDMIRFMEDASDNSQYHFRLAGILAEYLEPHWTVCDAGCGTGYLSIALSPYVKEVTAVDLSADAIAFLQQKASIEGLGNIKTITSDLMKLPGDMKFDAMVFNYFGKMEQIFEIASKHCLRRILIIKKNYTDHRFSIGKHPVGENGHSQALFYLREHSVNYTALGFDEDFGQPFRSLADALLFFEIYSRDTDRSIVKLENIQPRLMKTGNSLFPYYLPNRKSSIIYVVEGGSDGTNHG